MKEGLNILDALENLNTLVEADSLDEIEVTDDAHLIQHKGDIEGGPREIYWVTAGPDDQTLDAIKKTFKTVHDYLRTFYTKMKGGDTKRIVEGINTIMVLVGEATKKLERFGALFKERVVDFEEYKQLQNFYRNRVIKESFREFAKAPIAKEKPKGEILPELKEAEEELQELLEQEPIEEIEGVHILNDLDVIKRDHLYELFYLRNEAGHNFYTYDLARNIKLACDFGEFSQKYFGDDPLLQIKNWEDKSLHLLANDILKKSSRLIEKFYKEAMKYKGMELVMTVHNALMALMLAANPRNLIRQFSLKGSHLYFSDFLLFLREALKNREYQKFLIYSPPAGKTFFHDLLDLVHALCYHLFTIKAENEELQKALKQMIEHHAPKKTDKLSQNLIKGYEALTEVLKHHPNGPVFKAVDIIREEQEEKIFDPLFQGNIPGFEWSLKSVEKEWMALRLPTPIQQEFISKAYILDEFKTFLALCDRKEHLLFINFQDRTSWKEHARCAALEDLTRQAEFAESITLVTLAKDTDFYNQAGHYQELDEAKTFIEQFIQHLGDVGTGYYFPSHIKEALFPAFIEKLIPQIHDTFFEKKKRLSFLERLNFIQLTYHFIELKLIEIIDPTFFTLTSKDGLDIGGTTSVGLIALLTLSQKKKWSAKELDRLNTILFGPTLMNRERAIHPERFERLVSMIQLLETKGEYLKDFAPLFKKETFQWTVEI